MLSVQGRIEIGKPIADFWIRGVLFIVGEPVADFSSNWVKAKSSRRVANFASFCSNWGGFSELSEWDADFNIIGEQWRSWQS